MKIKIIVILLILFIITIAYFSIASALTGYSYKSDIDFTNSTSTNIYDRLTFNINANALGSGNYCQSDFDDVELTENDVIVPLTIIGTNETNPTWLVGYGTLPANSVTTYVLYMGNSSGTKNQEWVASGSDTVTITDHNDLDLETDFILNATIELVNIPNNDLAIISKTGTSNISGYELVVSNTPAVKFTVFSGSNPTSLSLDINRYLEYDISAWYYSGSLTLDSGTNQISTTFSGSISTNNEDIHICEFDGHCDNIYIRKN